MRKFADKVQRKISKGWRKEAQKLGQLWDIERNGVVIYRNKFYHLLRQHRASEDIELDPVSFIYRIRGDRRYLQLGDQLVGRDAQSKTEMSSLLERYTVISLRLVHENIAIRTDDNFKVYRPQQTIVNGYNFEHIDNMEVLTFNPMEGKWGWAPPGTAPTGVWIGKSFGGAGHEPNVSPELPYGTPQTGWVLSLGLLNGITFRESDICVDSDGNRYIVDRPYYQRTGAVLNQLHATRLRH